MRRFIRIFIIEAFALFAASQIAQGLVFKEGATTFVWASITLTVATFLVKPIINLLLLPLNIVTFGLFKWVGHAITLYLITLVIDDFDVVGFSFLGFTYSTISLPSLNLGSGPLAFIGFSLVLSFITGFIYWLVD